MASTPNGGKLDVLQDANTGATQPHSSKTDYKAVLDKVADKTHEKVAEEGGTEKGLVAKLVDQGKQLLGVNEEPGHNDKLAEVASEPEQSSSSTEHITDTHVQEFIRDAHRSQKLTPKTDGI